MFWTLFYLYIVGAVNDFMLAAHCDADLSDWRVHANIAGWPITVPIAIIASFFYRDEI